jgi:hypothetical protein
MRDKVVFAHAGRYLTGTGGGNLPSSFLLPYQFSNDFLSL